jgi:hypothetical protein
MLLLYRKYKDGFVWHFHTQCSDWPETNFVQTRALRLTQDERLCGKCAKLEVAMFPPKPGANTRRTLYRNYTLLTRAEFEPIKEAWRVLVTITWQVDANFHVHTLQPAILFSTEEGALVEGLHLAEGWVDQRL